MRSNGDKIRSMSDFDLAEFLSKIMDSCWWSVQRGSCNKECPMYECCNDQSSDNVEDWLKQEAEEGEL